MTKLLLSEWLGEHRSQVKINVFNAPGEPKTMMVRCGDQITASELWSRRNLLVAPEPLRLSIYVGRWGFDSILIDRSIRVNMGAILIPGNSAWANANQFVFQSFDCMAFIHSADRDLGYPYLAMHVPGPRRLNKPPEELIGSPIAITAEAIAIPKVAAIQEALELNRPIEYGYEYTDHLHWRFSCKVSPLGDGQVLVLVDDHERYKQAQRWYWENLV